MNKDQVSGRVEQAVGKVKQSVGETFGNETLANQGVVDQAQGAAKETWGNAKDAAKEVQRSHKNVATDKAHERRNKISQSVQNACLLYTSQDPPTSANWSSPKRKRPRRQERTLSDVSATDGYRQWKDHRAGSTTPLAASGIRTCASR